jgi:HPt (histidine-containing phosphotransfer) domain-containing protein
MTPEIDSMAPAFNHDELMDRIDGDFEFLEESIEMLEEDARPLVEQIRAAVAARDASSLASSAHTLKGMLSNFCAETAEGTAGDLERRGRENRLEDVAPVVDALDQAITLLRAELKAFLGENRQ